LWNPSARISKAFDTRIREAGTIDRKDPTGSLKNINRFGKKILPLLDEFRAEIQVELKRSMDLSKISPRLDKIAEDTLLTPGAGIIEEEIPDAYKLGDTFGRIQLDAARKRKKKNSC
jgi:hypothetical protein